METQVIITIVFIIGVSIILFLVLREVVCWYWKINSIVDNQKRTNDLLTKIFVQLGGKEEAVTNQFDKLELGDIIIVENNETKQTETMSFSQWKSKVYHEGYDKNHKIIGVEK